MARVTLDSMVQFVGLLDAQGTVLEINKVALDAVGSSLSEVENKPFWSTFWWQVSPEVNQGIRDMIARAAKGEFVRWDTEIYGRAGGKETIVIDASLMPVHDDDGNVVFLAAEGRDITEKKAHEREIAQKNLELSGLLERIRELDEIKTQFFANVSHELRTPLALILGPAQRLMEDSGELMIAQRRECAQVIARNARMLLKHVNDLLDISKVEAGKLKVELRDLDLATMVRFLASHFAVLAGERGIDFEVAAGEPLVAAADGDKLQRVLMNLLANAFKFAPDGGRVRFSLAATPDELIFRVDDSGPGVQPSMRRAIFERFRQADGGANRKQGGTGLGLAIVKEFVEMHKGRVEVSGSDLGGARFEVRLPRRRLGQAEAAQPSLDRTALDGLLEELRGPVMAQQPEAQPNPSQPLVLVVEDSAEMNRFVCQCLSRDYAVISAVDGREGLEKALRHHPSLIVTDIMMPNLSGDEMIAELRRQPELKLTPILLLSAKADDELRLQLLGDGAQDFVVKPFAEKELRVRVRNLITAQQLRETAENASRAKDEFLAMLGHELRNPLAPIVTALQIIKLRGAENADHARTIIERQVSHLARLVDDLLDVSRIARGKVELRTELIEVSEVVAKAIEMASPLLEQRHHALSVDVPRRGLAVNGDPTRLSQVVSNLLTNAAKYTAPGGRVSVEAGEEQGVAVIRVRDSGIGIGAAALPRVFDLFVQERQSIDRSQGGLGIGLTIVRNLVEQHGGSISAKSEGAGKGSEFTVRLPLAAQAQLAAQPSPAQPSGKHAAATTRILIVDDNEDAAELLVEALLQKGYDARATFDGPSALQLAETFAPQVAFLDIGLPVMDGYELASNLRAIPGLGALRLIAVTGYGQDSDRRRSAEAGFDLHMVKPVEIDEIEAAIEK